MCAIVKIDQPDFSVKFDQHWKAWTTLWKWTGDKEPPKLEYHMPDRIRPVYEHEFYALIKDSWLIPYPKS